MALRLRVCRIDQVEPGEVKGFAVSGVAVPVLVANIDGTYLATTSMCPHEDVSLLGGKRKGTQVICPGHGYRFDLRTGACSHDPNLCLARYRVSIVGDELYVDLV
ncbi:MAG: Rieske (2Fe-2S) protein [Myxococcota bacterium]